jgi:chromosomal replication initiator protein
MDPQKVWQSMLNAIKSQMSPANFNIWFANTDITQVTEDLITLSVPSAFIKEQLKKRYLDLLLKAAKEATQQDIEIDFIVDPSKALKKAVDKTKTGDDLFQLPMPVSRPVINPKFTLENFVVGLSNNVAFAAAKAVVENPGISYNPLFFYGGTGVGKTHLMLGIGNALLAKDAELKIIYCSSEKFTNDYVEAIQNHRMGDLRNKYRSADLLLVDDIQFFSGREGTQEEFFHTFNELTAKNSQIILTSDRAPGDIAKLEDRLKSRFQGGLMVDIQLPDFDTRAAILRSKCVERGEMLPEDCLNLIASSFQINIRELEGKLIQILQSLKAQNLPPTVESISQFLETRGPISPSNLNHKQVLSTICEYFNIKPADLTGPKRQKELVLPRHMAMHIMSEELKMTVERIGEILGGRDHTTVMHGRDRIRQLINTDREVQRIFIDVKNHLTSS